MLIIACIVFVVQEVDSLEVYLTLERLRRRSALQRPVSPYMRLLS